MSLFRIAELSMPLIPPFSPASPMGIVLVAPSMTPVVVLFAQLTMLFIMRSYWCELVLL